MLPFGSLFWECPPLEHPVYNSCSELVTVKHQSIALCRCNWCETDTFRLVLWWRCLRILVWKIFSPSERDKYVSLIVNSWNCVALDCIMPRAVSKQVRGRNCICALCMQVCSPTTGMFTYKKLCMCALCVQVCSPTTSGQEFTGSAWCPVKTTRSST